MKNVGILVRKADVIKNIQEFQSEEIVKLEKPADYLSSYEKHRINSKLKISKFHKLQASLWTNVLVAEILAEAICLPNRNSGWNS